MGLHYDNDNIDNIPNDFISVTAEELEIGKTHLQELVTSAEYLWVNEFIANGFNVRAANKAVGNLQATAGSHNWVMARREDSSKPHLWDIVENARNTRVSHLDATRERIMLEYSRIAFFDPLQMYDEDGNLLHPKDMPEDVRRAVAEFNIASVRTTDDEVQRIIKLKVGQKLQALKDLAGIIGITKETVVHEHKFADLLKEVQKDSDKDPLVIEDMTDDDE